MTITLGDTTLTGSEVFVFIAFCSIAGIVLLLSLGMIAMWIRYSWFARNNSKNWTGEDATRFIFKKSGMGGVEIKNSIFYVKYWNFNKRRGTYRLRPWTYSRRSIWTLMEASQQAYASSIRETKGTTFWVLFRLPGLIRIAGAIAGAIFIGLGVYNFDDSFGKWSLVVIGIAIVFIAYLIADAGRVWVLWKNVRTILADSGLTQKELKAINRIYFWRLMYSIAAVILEIVKLILRAADKQNNKRG